MSKRETILAAVKTSLTGITGIADAKVFRSRAAAVARKDFPCLIIESVSDVANQDTFGTLIWRLTFQCVVLVRSEAPDQDSDSAVADVHAKIMGNAPLAALVIDIVPVGVRWDVDEADLTLGMVTMQFAATYQTALTTIS